MPETPFRDILAYAPESDEGFVAVEQAAALARESGGKIRVMRVLEPGSRLLRWSRRARDGQNLRDLLAEAELEQLEARVAPLRSEGIPIDVQVRWGTPWMELVYAVLRDGHDLVVKAAEGATRNKGLFFGSTALHLIRKCPCPVWVAHTPGKTAPKRVLAAVDPAAGDQRPDVARRVLRLATTVAGDDGEVQIASVWRAAGEMMLQGRMSRTDLADYVEAAREEAQTGLAEATACLGEPVPPERTHLVKGEPSDVLPALVDRLAPDLLVMGSLGRTGVRGLLIGDTAETLVRSVRCAVLVVKPPGFTSLLEQSSDPTASGADSV